MLHCMVEIVYHAYDKSSLMLSMFSFIELVLDDLLFICFFPLLHFSSTPSFFPFFVPACYCSHTVLRGFGFVWHSCDCAHLCVCTRIKPTSISWGSRGKKAPLRPPGEGIPFVCVPPRPSDPLTQRQIPFGLV